MTAAAGGAFLPFFGRPGRAGPLSAILSGVCLYFAACRNGIAAFEPAMKINVGTAFRAKRARRISRRFYAYWAGPERGSGFVFACVFAKQGISHGRRQFCLKKTSYTLFSQPEWTGKPSPASNDRVSRSGRPTTAE